MGEFRSPGSCNPYFDHFDSLEFLAMRLIGRVVSATCKQASFTGVAILERPLMIRICGMPATPFAFFELWPGCGYWPGRVFAPWWKRWPYGEKVSVARTCRSSLQCSTPALAQGTEQGPEWLDYFNLLFTGQLRSTGMESLALSARACGDSVRSACCPVVLTTVRGMKWLGRA